MTDHQWDDGVAEESLARTTLATILPGSAPLPPSSVDLTDIVRRGRRRIIVRRVGYATGGTAVAGVLAIGAVRLPGSTSDSRGAAAGGTSKLSTSADASAVTSKSSRAAAEGTPHPTIQCAASSVDWAALVGGALPSGMTGALSHGPTCSPGKFGAPVVEVIYALSGKRGVVQVQTWTTGGSDPSTSAGSSPANGRQKVGAPSPSSSGDQPSCTQAGDGVQICTRTAAKGPMHAVAVDLVDTKNHRYVSVVASGEGTAYPVLSGAQTAAVAEAVDAAL